MTYSEITADVNYLSRSTSASYPITDVTRNINNAYQEVAALLWNSSNKWHYDDSQYDTLPVASADMEHSQKDYELPSTAQRIIAVEIKDKEGTLVRLSPTVEQRYTGSGFPVDYRLVGRSILLDPTPSSAYCTLSAGLQVTVDRDVSAFATGDTTREPGFARQFHRILSYSAAIDFTDDYSYRDRLIKDKEELKKGLVILYSGRTQELRTKITPQRKSLWRQYK